MLARSRSSAGRLRAIGVCSATLARCPTSGDRRGFETSGWYALLDQPALRERSAFTTDSARRCVFRVTKTSLAGCRGWPPPDELAKVMAEVKNGRGRKSSAQHRLTCTDLPFMKRASP
jgi:hypothetical protein